MAESLFSRHELAGPYRLSQRQAAELDEQLKADSLTAIRFNPTEAKNRSNFLTQLGGALAFPANFGANFDALYDSLCDTALLPAPSLIIIIENISGLDEDDSDTLIAVLQAAADDWREQGRSLWALFATPGIDLDPLPKA